MTTMSPPHASQSASHRKPKINIQALSEAWVENSIIELVSVWVGHIIQSLWRTQNSIWSWCEMVMRISVDSPDYPNWPMVFWTSLRIFMRLGKRNSSGRSSDHLSSVLMAPLRLRWHCLEFRIIEARFSWYRPVLWSLRSCYHSCHILSVNWTFVRSAVCLVEKWFCYWHERSTMESARM